MRCCRGAFAFFNTCISCSCGCCRSLRPVHAAVPPQSISEIGELRKSERRLRYIIFPPICAPRCRRGCTIAIDRPEHCFVNWSSTRRRAEGTVRAAALTSIFVNSSSSTTDATASSSPLEYDAWIREIAPTALARLQKFPPSNPTFENISRDLSFDREPSMRRTRPAQIVEVRFRCHHNAACLGPLVDSGGCMDGSGIPEEPSRCICLGIRVCHWRIHRHARKELLPHSGLPRGFRRGCRGPRGIL